MVPLLRLLFHAQVLICLLYGMVGGAALSAYAERQERRARDYAQIEMLLSLSLEQLSQVKVSSL